MCVTLSEVTGCKVISIYFATYEKRAKHISRKCITQHCLNQFGIKRARNGKQTAPFVHTGLVYSDFFKIKPIDFEWFRLAYVDNVLPQRGLNKDSADNEDTYF